MTTSSLTDVLCDLATDVPEVSWPSMVRIAEPDCSEFNLTHALHAMAGYRDAVKLGDAKSIVFWHHGLAAAARRLQVAVVA